MIGTRLVVGYEPDFAPLSFREGEEARGIVIDVLAACFAPMGRSSKFVPVPLSEHDAAIVSGRIDAVAYKAITAEREGLYDFSDPITNSGAAWFIVAGRSMEATGPAPGTRLATPTRGPLLARLRRDYPDVAMVDVGTYAEALGAVVRGDADCAALNFHVGRYLASRDFAGRFDLPETQEPPAAITDSPTRAC